MTNITATPRAGRREWLALAVLGLPSLLVAMDFSVLYLAVPHLSADLAPSSIQQLWIVDMYGFVIAGLLVTMGTLGDRIGRKKVLLMGAALFSVASILAAYSSSPEMLIGSRALLGVAGSMVMPQVMALVNTLFADPKERGRAISVYLTCFMGGIALGPVVGGVLLHFFWWGSVFLISVPGMAVLLLLGPSLLPEQRSPEAGKLDPVSVVLSLAAVLPAVYGLKELARNGWHWFPIVATLFGILMGFLFCVRQNRLTHPLLDLTMFKNRVWRSAQTILFVAGVVGTGTYLIITLFLQDVVGVNVLTAGLLLVPPSLLIIVGNMVSPSLANRIRPAYIIAGGLLLSTVGYLMFLFVSAGSGFAMIFVAFCVVTIGTGPMASLGNHLAMGAAPLEKMGAAAGITQTSNELGLGLGVAIFGTIATAVYRINVGGTLNSLPAHAASAARENIDGAIAAASTLPAAQSRTLLDAARIAFTSGIHTLGVINAVGFILLTVFGVVTLKHVRKLHGGVEAPAPADAEATDSIPDAA